MGTAPWLQVIFANNGVFIGPSPGIFRTTITSASILHWATQNLDKEHTNAGSVGREVGFGGWEVARILHTIHQVLLNMSMGRNRSCQKVDNEEETCSGQKLDTHS